MCKATKKCKTNYSRTKKKKQRCTIQNRNKPSANHKSNAAASQSKKDNLKWIDELELIDIIFDD